MGEGGGGEEKGRFLSFSSLLFSLPSFPFSLETLDTQAKLIQTPLFCRTFINQVRHMSAAMSQQDVSNQSQRLPVMQQACNSQPRMLWSTETKAFLKSLKIAPLNTLPLSMDSFHIAVRYNNNDSDDRPFLQPLWFRCKTHLKYRS